MAETPQNKELNPPSGGKTASPNQPPAALPPAGNKPAGKESANATAKPVQKTAGPEKEKVVYRVQISASTKSKGSYTVRVNGKDWKTYEYRYKGAYRQCIGNFSSLEPAKELQDAGRRSGYPQAFVVVFVNGTRSIDPKYFR